MCRGDSVPSFISGQAVDNTMGVGYEEHLVTRNPDQFRRRLGGLLQPKHDDFYLLRWLRARDFSLEKAESMIRESMSVRTKWKLDTLLQTYKVPEVLGKFYPGGYFGNDKEGTPVFIDPIGQIDFRGLLSSVKQDEIVKFKSYIAEYGLHLAAEQSVKLGRRIEQTVIIMDMEGLGLKHLWRPGVTVFNKVAAFYEDNYPEVMKKIFIIKAPKLFPVAYSLVKPFLSEVTRGKVTILGSDWKTELQQFIDEDNLPVFYGGRCKDANGDPKCSSQICYGGDVPEAYFFSGKKLKNEDNYQKGYVGRGATLKLSYKVDLPGTTISWEFQSEDYDIGFGVYYTAETAEDVKLHTRDMEEVIPTERIDSHMVPEQGSLRCEKAGLYVLRFDNTYSWTRSKKVLYNVQVLRVQELNGDEPTE